MVTYRIGTSGWHYPGGKGTWNGIFYPPTRGRSKTFDELSFYAEHFNTVELNTTFYGQPRASVSRSWADRTPAGFEFSVKLYQKFTHPNLFAERVKASLPTEESGPGSEPLVQELARPNLADVDEFKRGIDPLASAGKLGALLAQFPASFKNGDRERAYLTRLLEDFRGFPIAVELRHASWSDAVGETITLLNAFGAAWVQIDEPKFRFSIRQNFLPNIKGFYYMRLHGRNAAQWWKHDKSEDRYNYLYSGGRTDRVQRNRQCGADDRQKAVPVLEQSLLRQVGRQRGDDQATAGRAAYGEYLGRLPGSLPGSGNTRQRRSGADTSSATRSRTRARFSRSSTRRMTASARSAPMTGAMSARVLALTRSVSSGFSLVPGAWRVK